MSKPAWLRASTWLTLLAWALVAASGVYWYFLMQSSASAPALVSAPTKSTTPTNVIASTVVNTPASSRFALHGVLYQGRGGVALIATDGKPAKHYRVGAEVESGLVLQAVARRSATLGPAGGEAAFTLELPAPTVMVSNAVSPALSSRPLAPGTPASTLGGSAARAAAPTMQPGLASSAISVQVPGMGGVPADASMERPNARGAGLRSLMQGTAGLTGSTAAPAEAASAATQSTN
jgi:general secretion pathway protein C